MATSGPLQIAPESATASKRTLGPAARQFTFQLPGFPSGSLGALSARLCPRGGNLFLMETSYGPVEGW